MSVFESPFGKQCHHQWQEQERAYAPPPTRAMNATGMDDAVIRQIVLGVTTIIQRCRICGSLQTTEVLGQCVTPAKEAVE